MAIFTTTEDVSGILPADYGDLVIQPAEAASIALQVSDVKVTANHDYIIPIVTDNGDAGWYEEGQDLLGNGPTFDQIKVTPAKVARVVPISNELADDSDPSATAVVGDALGQAVAVQIDKAYFQVLASPAPAGLQALAGVTHIDAGGAWANLDPFAAGQVGSEGNGGRVAYWVANPTTALALLELKDQTDSNRPLLGADPTVATRRTILGAPLLISPYVHAGVVWGIDPSASKAVLRKDVTVETSRDQQFSSDMTLVKVVARLAFAFPAPARLVKVSLTGDNS